VPAHHLGTTGVSSGVYRSIEMGARGAELPAGPFLAVHATAPAETAGLVVTLVGGSVRLPSDWLRDNCPCAECRIMQTDERRRRPWLDLAAPMVTHPYVSNGDLCLTWADGHRTVYSADAWSRIRLASRRGSYTANLWTGGYELSRFAHDAVLADAAIHRQMFEAFRGDGAVVVTSAPTVPGTVIEFARSIGLALIDSSLGFIFDVKVDPAGYNVAFTSEELPPHNDNAQYTNPPSGQILSMLVNDATGGNTIVVDGWSVLEQLRAADPAAIDVLSRVEVGFRQYSTEADGFSRNPLVRHDATGRFTHLRFSNQLMQPLPFDHPDLAEWYRAYRLLGRMVSDPANQIRFRMRAGDMLFVNGYRALHARTAFTPDGPRHLQDVYFSTDDVNSVLARLTGETTNAMTQS
jgi:gamma-butyrobetaine dioxygenase